jgi:hypothetical protein
VSKALIEDGWMSLMPVITMRTTGTRVTFMPAKLPSSVLRKALDETERVRLVSIRHAPLSKRYRNPAARTSS